MVDREHVARLLGFNGVIEHTRDAMWQLDGLVSLLASSASLVTSQSKLAEDLEIWSSEEFDFVDLAEPLHPSQRADAAEAEPLRGGDRAGRRRCAHRPAHGIPRRGARGHRHAATT